MLGLTIRKLLRQRADPGQCVSGLQHACFHGVANLLDQLEYIGWPLDGFSENIAADCITVMIQMTTATREKAVDRAREP